MKKWIEDSPRLINFEYFKHSRGNLGVSKCAEAYQLTLQLE